MGRLTALAARNLNKLGRHGDGNGLYLNITPSGSKSWGQRIVIHGRRTDIELGPYPASTLLGPGPLPKPIALPFPKAGTRCTEKRQAREAARKPASSTPTFAEAAARVIELRRPTWSNPNHAAQWQSTLQTYAFPLIGRKTVYAITAADVLDALTPI